MTGPNSSAFLRAIAAAPGDDAPRLVYADWLDERGTEEGAARADLIRIGMRLAKFPDHYDPDDKVTDWATRDILKGKQLWLATSFAGVGLIHEELRAAVGQGPTICYRWHDHGEIVYDMDRGFVDRIDCPTATFLAHAAALFSAHPITAVRLTDAIHPREYGAGDDRWAVYRNDLGPLWPILCPNGSNDVFAERRDRDELEQALSVAALAYGRQLAGLPLAPA